MPRGLWRRPASASALVRIFDSLLGFEMKFDPEPFIRRIDKAERMASEAVHLTQARRNPAVAHQDHHLMEGLRRETPKIPRRRCAAQVGFRVALLRVDKIGKFERIPDKKDRCIVPHQIPVTFVGVKFDRKTAHIALGIGSAALAGNGRKAYE